MLTDSDLQAIWLTAKLASIVTLILLVIAGIWSGVIQPHGIH